MRKMWIIEPLMFFVLLMVGDIDHHISMQKVIITKKYDMVEVINE